MKNVKNLLEKNENRILKQITGKNKQLAIESYERMKVKNLVVKLVIKLVIE